MLTRQLFFRYQTATIKPNSALLIPIVLVYMSNAYCLFLSKFCFAAEVWAAWVQAIGSVVAIIVALALLQIQFYYQGKTNVLVERNRRAGVCAKNYQLACSAIAAMRSYQKLLPDTSAGNARHLKFPQVWVHKAEIYSPSDMSFLIQEGGADALSMFYSIHYIFSEWTARLERLFVYRDTKIATIIDVESWKAGHLLSDSELITAVGPYYNAELIRLTGHIENLTLTGIDEIEKIIPQLEKRLKEIFSR